MDIPLAAVALAEKLQIHQTAGQFEDRFNAVPVFEVKGGLNGFTAFVYMCRLNLDKDGTRTSYGYDNPAKGSLQKNLNPLEGYQNGPKKMAHAMKEKIGLGNACGDPGDGTKGWRNFLAGNRKFYWAGVVAVTKQQARAQGLTIDDRLEVEAGMETYVTNGRPVLKPVGSGYYPVVQSNPTSPSAGYYVSGTSVAVNGNLALTDPDRYLDSSTVPYAVWATHWNKINIGGMRVQQGDFGLAIDNSTGANTGFVFGDSGTPNKVGESSQMLNDTMGNTNGLVTFIAFPGSGSGKSLGGVDPRLLIPFQVLRNMIKLRTNASELAEHLAMGPHLSAPKHHAGRTPAQQQLYKNFMTAFSSWTITT